MNISNNLFVQRAFESLRIFEYETLPNSTKNAIINLSKKNYLNLSAIEKEKVDRLYQIIAELPAHNYPDLIKTHEIYRSLFSESKKAQSSWNRADDAAIDRYFGLESLEVTIPSKKGEALERIRSFIRTSGRKPLNLSHLAIQHLPASCYREPIFANIEKIVLKNNPLRNPLTLEIQDVLNQGLFSKISEMNSLSLTHIFSERPLRKILSFLSPQEQSNMSVLNQRIGRLVPGLQAQLCYDRLKEKKHSTLPQYLKKDTPPLEEIHQEILEAKAKNIADRDLILFFVKLIPPEDANKITLLQNALRTSKAPRIEMARVIRKFLEKNAELCRQFTYILIRKATLTSIPPEIRYFSEIESLEIVEALITSVPPEIGTLSKLQTLDLSHNKIDFISPAIGHLSQLAELRLDHNCIHFIPQELFHLPKLRELDLHDNEIFFIPPDLHLPEICHLDLRKNKLSLVPSSIYRLTTLTSLDLSNNQITAVSRGIANLKNLKSLNLSHNQLPEIPSEIFYLGTLEDLRFNDNKINTVPSAISNLQKLHTFYVKKNQITFIAPEIHNLPRLENHSFDENPIDDLPPDPSYDVSGTFFDPEARPSP